MPHKILVVDEMVDMLEIIAAIVQSAGYTVITAKEGSEVLRNAERDIPSLIVVDVFHSRRDWSAVFEALGKNPITKDIPILILTEKVGSFQPEQGFPLSASDYLTKPLSPEGLLQKIKTHLPAIEM
ncbi:MAG: response regulator [Nitrospirae bacterium]|nr:response regulator [Candidatus Manganitrophaceae bacterium]